MGRYRAKRVIVREIGKMSIVFWLGNAIYIYPDGMEQQGYVFHTWYMPLGSYQERWRPFRDMMLKTKKLDFIRCCQLADRYGVLINGAVGRLDLNNRPLEIRYQGWKILGVG